MYAIGWFVVVLVLAIAAFALTFNLQLEDGVATSNSTFGAPGIAGVGKSMWATFLFAILGVRRAHFLDLRARV